MQFLKFILSTHCVYLTINGSAIGSSGDDALLSIKKMSNQRFVVSGGTNTAAGYKHNLLMILNSQLNVMNSAAINFPFKTLILRNAVENSDGSITAFNYDYLAGNTDMGLVKFDSMLNMTWAKWYGDNALNKTLHGLIKDGNIYSIGMGEGFGFVDTNIIMVQTDLNGNTAQQCYSADSFPTQYTYSYSSIGYTPTISPVLLYTQVAASAITSQIGHIQICNYLLAPAVNLASSDTIFCDKNSVNFFLSANNPTSWLWFFQGGRPSVSTAQNPTNIYFPNAGAFDVLLIACNSAGCDTLFIPGFIIEYPLPVPPIVTLQGDTLYCSLANQYQ